MYEAHLMSTKWLPLPVGDPAEPSPEPYDTHPWSPRERSNKTL